MKLVDRDAAVAEIKAKVKYIYAGREYVGVPSWDEREIDGLEEAIEIINTLEVKEVDLWEELGNYIEHYRNRETGYTMFDIAEHFFELGMQVSNRAQNIWHDANEKLPAGVIVVNNGGHLHIGWSTDEGDGIEDEHGRLITKTYQKWAREEDLTTRTDIDAFAGKAKKWFEEHFESRLKWEIATYEFKDMQNMVEDFRKAMED